MIIKKGLAALALGVLSWAAQAGPYFASKDGSMVWDEATGLVWMRCSLGQRWDGKTCAGVAKEYTFEAAQETAPALNRASGFGGYRDWRVPTVRQLASLVLCTKGLQMRSEDINGSAVLCTDGSAKPTTDPNAFPRTRDYYYWSSAPHVGNVSSAWFVEFYYGIVNDNSPRSNSYPVRLVRASQLSGGKAALDFPRALPMADERAWATAERAREAAEDSREAAAKQETAMSRSSSSSRTSSIDACSHLYVGKTVELRNPTFGYTVNAEIRGLGSTRASVRYRHPLTGDIESNELDCNTLR